MGGSSGAIFLSYARDDAAAARRIAEALRARGLEVWFDETELRGGDPWDAKIRKQIRECALFLAVISTTTQERGEGYFRREWKQAGERTLGAATSPAGSRRRWRSERRALHARTPNTQRSTTDAQVNQSSSTHRQSQTSRVGRSLNAGLLVSCLCMIGLVVPMLGAAVGSIPGAPAGRVVNLSLHSAVLGRDVPLHVWLPPGYDAPSNTAVKYPVMYVFDGARMFDAVAGDKGVLHLDPSLERLTAQGKIAPIIVVAIDQPPTEKEREQEYSPYRRPFDSGESESRGGLLPSFLTTEVLPKIGATFRVTHDFQETGIGGFSLGAAAALYVLINRPGTFGLAILESPSLQLGNGQLLRDTVSLVTAGRRVAIGVGTRELGQDEETLTHGSRKGDVNRALVRWCETLAGNLRGASLPPAVLLTVEDGAQHKGEAWARRFPMDFVFLFGKHPEPK